MNALIKNKIDFNWLAFNWITWIAALLLLAMFSSAIQAQPQITAEQRRQFEQLTPQQRQMVMDQLGGSLNGGSLQMSERLEQPEVITPRNRDQAQNENETSEKNSPFTEVEVLYRRDELGNMVPVIYTPPVLNDDELETAESLEPFGYDLFAGEPSTFAPATDIPVPADYVLGPGDVVKLQLYGNQNAEYELVVDRGGRVNIPQLGPIYLARQNFAQAKRLIEQEIAEKMIGVSASISMGELRSIRVFVLGDAYRPGSYTVSGLSSITNALFVSGGIKEIGSLRNVQLKRNGRTIAVLDLYDLLLRGDTRNDLRLQAGDAIFIPPVGRTVGVGGEVRRPAIYELRGESTLRQVVDLAGGPLPSAALSEVKIERVGRGGNREIIDASIATNSGRSAAVRDGDLVTLLPVLEEVGSQIVLSGHVQRSGNYQWRKGMRLTNVLPTPSALLPKADFDYVLIKRETGADRQITTLAVSLTDAFQRPQSPANPVLRPQDEIIVFSREESREEEVAEVVGTLQSQARYGAPQPVVTVNGMVKHPGDYPMQTGMTVLDLVRAGGGLLESAYPLEAEVTRFIISPSGERDVIHNRVNLAAALAGDSSQNLLLQPYDALTIKVVPQWAGLQTVELFGEVKFPGQYTIHKGETLRELIARAGGLTSLAYAEGSVFTRELLREKEAERQAELAQRLEADIAAISLEQAQSDGSGQAVDAAKGLLKQVSELKPLGRLVIDLPAIISGQAETPIYLVGGDALYVPLRPQEVTVIGEVQFPTSHVYKPSWDRGDYIDRSGGTTYRADESRIFVVKANGAVIVGSSGWFDNDGEQIGVGDTVVVPLDADRVKPLTLWSEVSEIVYQIALSVAAFKTVGAF